jgi:hypothetical protein
MRRFVSTTLFELKPGRFEGSTPQTLARSTIRSRTASGAPLGLATGVTVERQLAEHDRRRDPSACFGTHLR